MENGKPEDSPQPTPPPAVTRKSRSATSIDIIQIKRLRFIRLMDFASEVGDSILLDPRPKPPDGFSHIFRARNEGGVKTERSYQETQELVSFWRCVSGDLLRAAMKHARHNLNDDDNLHETEYDPDELHRKEMKIHRRIVARLLVVQGVLDRCLNCGKQWKADGGANNEFVKDHLLQGDYKPPATTCPLLDSGSGNRHVWWNILPICCPDRLPKTPTGSDLFEDLSNDLNMGLDFFPENMFVGMAFWFKIMKRDPFSRTRDLLDKKKQDAYKERLSKEYDRCVDEMYTCAKTASELVLILDKPWKGIEETSKKAILSDLNSFIERTKKFDGSIADTDFDTSSGVGNIQRLSKRDANLLKSIMKLDAQVSHAENEGLSEEEEEEQKARVELKRKIGSYIGAIKTATETKRTMEEIHRALNTVIPNLPSMIKDRQRRVKNIAMSLFVHVCRLLSETGYTRPQDAIDEDSLINFVLGFFFVNTEPRRAIDPEVHELLDWRFLKLTEREQGFFKQYDVPSPQSAFPVED